MDLVVKYKIQYILQTIMPISNKSNLKQTNSPVGCDKIIDMYVKGCGSIKAKISSQFFLLEKEKNACLGRHYFMDLKYLK